MTMAPCAALTNGQRQDPSLGKTTRLHSLPLKFKSTGTAPSLTGSSHLIWLMKWSVAPYRCAKRCHLPLCRRPPVNRHLSHQRPSLVCNSVINLSHLSTDAHPLCSFFYYFITVTLLFQSTLFNSPSARIFLLSLG